MWHESESHARWWPRPLNRDWEYVDSLMVFWRSAVAAEVKPSCARQRTNSWSWAQELLGWRARQYGGDTVEMSRQQWNCESSRCEVRRCVCRGEKWLGSCQPQVTMLKPRRWRPHAYIAEAQLSLCTSLNLDLSFLVVTAPFESKQQTRVHTPIALHQLAPSAHVKEVLLYSMKKHQRKKQT